MQGLKWFERVLATTLFGLVSLGAYSAGHWIMNNDQVWDRLFRVDTLISLLSAGVTLGSGVVDDVPWAYRIPAALLASCAALWLWRHLTLRRLLMPNRLQPLYDTDVIDINELFQGRSFIRGVTFRNCEIKGPGSLALIRPIMRSNSFNPSLETLLVIVPPETSLLPHPQFLDCVFENCMFTSCGLIAIPSFADSLRESCRPPELRNRIKRKGRVVSATRPLCNLATGGPDARTAKNPNRI